MNIIVNAKPHDITATTLDAVLIELGFTSKAIATARNGIFVPAADRSGTALQQGDRLEILSPMQGG